MTHLLQGAGPRDMVPIALKHKQKSACAEISFKRKYAEVGA
jgi:hypothetical protein